MNAVFAALLLLAAPAGDAPEPAPAGETMELKLEILPVLDATPRRFVFVIGGVAYETEAGLRMYIEVMPKGRTIVLDPGCRRMGGEPLLEDEKALKDFGEFVKKHGSTLKIIPSG